MQSNANTITGAFDERVPNPPFCTVSAMAIHDPSGDGTSACQTAGAAHPFANRPIQVRMTNGNA
jgi:hypothetical protein